VARAPENIKTVAKMATEILNISCAKSFARPKEFKVVI
jgi:hypothetical protein